VRGEILRRRRKKREGMIYYIEKISVIKSLFAG